MLNHELISNCVSILVVAATVVGVVIAFYYACKFIGKIISLLD